MQLCNHALQLLHASILKFIGLDKPNLRREPRDADITRPVLHRQGCAFGAKQGVFRAKLAELACSAALSCVEAMLVTLNVAHSLPQAI